MIMRKTKQKQKRFKMMHSKNGKDLSPIEFYLLTQQLIRTNMNDWVNSHDSKHVAEVYKLERQQNNPLWAYQSVIAKDATRGHGNYLQDVTEGDISELSDYWETLTPEQQKQEAISMWARLKWVNSAYRGLNDIFTAFDREYLNKQQGKDYLTPKDGVLKTLDDLSLSLHTWGAFSLLGHQNMGWHHPHSIGGGAMRDAQRHQGQETPTRKSKITDDALITAIESFKASHNGERHGLNKNLSTHLKVDVKTIGNRLNVFIDENPTHVLTLFIKEQ